MVTAQRFTLQIEEKLLLKLLSFFGYDQAESGKAVRSTPLPEIGPQWCVSLLCIGSP